jgi:hypothetical protein
MDGRHFLDYSERMTRLALATLLFCSCEKVDYIELSPTSIILKQPNNTIALEAKAMARNGARAVKAHINWSVADTSIAKVSEKGVVSPVTSGETEVIAKVGDIEARVPIQVIYVEKIEVEPKVIKMLDTDAPVTLKVTATGKNGRLITDRTVQLQSSNKLVAQIGGAASIMPLDPGITTITVQVDGQKASVEMTVEKDLKKK